MFGIIKYFGMVRKFIMFEIGEVEIERFFEVCWLVSLFYFFRCLLLRVFKNNI